MQHIFDARAMIQDGLVLSIDDTGQVQTCTVQTSPGTLYSKVRVIQPYGHASVPPGDGCTCVLMAMGGDPANMVALLTNNSARFGNQAQGEAALYNAKNKSRVAVRANGVIDITAGSVVNITAPHVTITSTGTVTVSAEAVTISSSGATTISGAAGRLTLGANAAITGDLVVTGAITCTGTLHAGGGIH